MKPWAVSKCLCRIACLSWVDVPMFPIICCTRVLAFSGTYEQTVLWCPHLIWQCNLVLKEGAKLNLNSFFTTQLTKRLVPPAIPIFTTTQQVQVGAAELPLLPEPVVKCPTPDFTCHIALSLITRRITCPSLEWRVELTTFPNKKRETTLNWKSLSMNTHRCNKTKNHRIILLFLLALDSLTL